MDEAQGTLYAEERREKIASLLRERKKVAVNALCDRFGVSAATVRSDLREMQKAGQLTRTHGGAIVRTHTASEAISSQKVDKQVRQKRRIAEAALALVENGDTILIDTGTTTLEFASRLAERRDLKVVTNDIEIARCLERVDCGQVIVLGGILRKGFHCLVRSPGAAPLRDLTVDKAFMGANGLSTDKGATTPDVQQAETKKSMLEMSNHVVLLCDSSKIGRVSFARFASLDEIDTLETDALDDATAENFREGGMEVVIAAPAAK